MFIGTLQHIEVNRLHPEEFFDPVSIQFFKPGLMFRLVFKDRDVFVVSDCLFEKCIIKFHCRKSWWEITLRNFFKTISSIKSLSCFKYVERSQEHVGTTFCLHPAKRFLQQQLPGLEFATTIVNIHKHFSQSDLA